MRRLLLDANLSPRTSAFLRSEFGFNVVDLTSLALTHLEDPEVIEFAKAESRIILTEDLDFGRLYFHVEQAAIGLIVLRLRPQSTSAVNLALQRFFTTPGMDALDLERSVVVIDNRRVRVTTLP